MGYCSWPASFAVAAALVAAVGCGARSGLPWEAQEYPAADAGPDASAEPDGCVNLTLGYEPYPATVMLLVDRSGSMDEPFGTGTRWSVLGEALFDPDRGVASQLEETVRFGMALYTSYDGGPGCPVLDDVPIAIGNAAEIEAFFATSTPLPDGDTPTGDSIVAVTRTLVAYAEPGPKYILLVTDGEPDTCLIPDPQTGQPEAIAAAQDAYRQGTPLFIIGVSSEIAPVHLQHMANAGAGKRLDLVWGVDANAAQPHQASEDQAQLATQITGMLGAARTCIIGLNETVDPARAGEARLLLDGRPLEHRGADGWILLDATTIEVLGAPCESILSTGRQLTIEYPCD